MGVFSASIISAKTVRNGKTLRFLSGGGMKLSGRGTKFIWSIRIPLKGVFVLVKKVPLDDYITKIKSSLSSIKPPMASMSSNRKLPGLDSIKKGFSRYFG